MGMVLSNIAKNLRLSALATAISNGANPSVLQLMQGVQPAGGGTSTTPLASIVLPVPLTESITNGVLTFVAMESTTVQESGEALWARVVNGNGEWIIDMDVGLTGSGAPVTLDDTVLFQGASISVISGVIQE